MMIGITIILSDARLYFHLIGLSSARLLLTSGYPVAPAVFMISTSSDNLLHSLERIFLSDLNFASNSIGCALLL
jgi:hypothetical protein